MPRQFLTGLNLNKNELLNARIQNLANDPSNPVLGQIYFNTSANEMRVYNGTVFEAVGLNGVTADAAEINILDGATLTTTELNYVDGVTSSIQTQLDAKAPINNPIFTGDVSLVSNLVFEGSSADSNELTVTATNPTADRTITLPDATGTVILSTNTVSDLTAPTGSFSMNSQKITSLADPVDAQDAATKAYVDAARSGLDVKASVRVATTENLENLTSSGTSIYTIDGVTLANGDRVLVKNQSTASENGIWRAVLNGTLGSGGYFTFTRTDDANSSAEVTAGMFTFVSEGTTNADSGWVLTTNDTITLGTTGLTFAQFSGAGQITAGAGLTKTGNTIDAVGTADRITVNADSIDIASTYAGQNTIATVGTITTGTWQATDVGVAHGGTGASDAAGAKTNLGFMTRVAANNTLLVPSSGIVTWAVTHNLGTKDITVQVYDLSNDTDVEVDVVRTSTSVVTLSWVAGANVTADSYRVVVVG
jgi:hypothetical protein